MASPITYYLSSDSGGELSGQVKGGRPGAGRPVRRFPSQILIKFLLYAGNMPSLEVGQRKDRPDPAYPGLPFADNNQRNRRLQCVTKEINREERKQEARASHERCWLSSSQQCKQSEIKMFKGIWIHY